MMTDRSRPGDGTEAAGERATNPGTSVPMVTVVYSVDLTRVGPHQWERHMATELADASPGARLQVTVGSLPAGVFTRDASYLLRMTSIEVHGSGENLELWRQRIAGAARLASRGSAAWNSI